MGVGSTRHAVCMRILLVQWDAAAGADRAEVLRSVGHEVTVESSDGAAAYRIARQQRPDAVVLDLALRPSHSWQTARPLASDRKLRLIFVDGTPEARERAKLHAPDATFTTTDGLLDTLADG